ncbi:hypothetical protein HUB97_08935 [Halorubraceae archaeon YAN]|nr:hypothetical protein [Halorubraceae archaeon YAN]
MTIAAETRAAVRRQPFLHTALRAGVVNYTAAAASLAVDGDTESVAAALRRYANELSPIEVESRSVTVRMKQGVSLTEQTARSSLLVVGDSAIASTKNGPYTALLMAGAVDTLFIGKVLTRLSLEDIEPSAVGCTSTTGVIVVKKRHAVSALQIIEETAATDFAY